MIDSFDQPAWVEAMIDDIAASGIAVVTLIIRNAAEPASAPVRPSVAYRARQWIRNRHLLLYALYERIDQRKFGTPDDPLRNVDVSARLRDVPVIEAVPRQTKFSDYLSDADVDRA